ncbi:MAG TPA: hypothetical protein VM869_10005 [Enhygromyxa sp.]|nr:hypothetical protein [Enhygromyxa sp.]
MTTKLSKLLILATLALAAPLGCKDKEAETPKEVKVLEAASNGSPISAELVKFTGEGEGRGMEVLLYNTGDKTAVAYFLLFRYYDANDKLLKVKPGTPFEADHDFTSMSGNKYKCEPKQNVTLEIEGDFIAVPPEAVRAEILASQVRSVAADGTTIEDWWSQENFGEWPAK